MGHEWDLWKCRLQLCVSALNECLALINLLNYVKSILNFLLANAPVVSLLLPLSSCPRGREDFSG